MLGVAPVRNRCTRGVTASLAPHGIHRDIHRDSFVRVGHRADSADHHRPQGRPDIIGGWTGRPVSAGAALAVSVTVQAVATFDRDADTFLEAVVSAINDIESTGYDVISVVDDDLVSVAEIAERLGRTRQSVNMHITGDRGPTLFPAPAFAHAGRNKLWRWADGARYFGQATPELLARTSTVVAVNAQLQLRAACRASDSKGGTQ